MNAPLTDWLVALVIVLAVFAAASLAVALWDWWTDRRQLRHRRVMVHIKGSHETTFHGVVWRKSGRLLVLRDAETFDVRRGGARVPLDGEVVIERVRVEWIHLPGRGDSDDRNPA